MLEDYRQLLAAAPRERRDVYEAAASELDTRGEFAEKDLWVCLSLELLFGSSKPPCAMTFKGGTSLSKAFGLIRRFSEDIDIVLAADGLGVDHDLEALRQLSGKQQRKAFEALSTAGAAYVAGPLARHIRERLTGIEGVDVQVDVNDDQTLLVSFPSVYGTRNDYVRSAVRIECGPRSAHEPATNSSVAPYVAKLLQSDLAVPDVPTIKAERTFWEKVFILHGHHCRYRDEGVVPTERNRLSRHYYDVAMMLDTPAGANAVQDVALLDRVRSHNQLAFPSTWKRYDQGVPGSVLIIPQGEVRKAIEADYAQMQAMVFGDVPKFAWVLKQIARLQQHLNDRVVA